MFETLKQSIFTSVGLATLAADKVKDLADEVARRAQLSEHEAKAFQEELGKRAQTARDDLKREIDERVNHALVQIGIIKAGARKASESARDDVQGFVRTRVDEAIDSLGLAREEEVQALQERIRLLEQKVVALQTADKPAAPTGDVD